MSSDTTDNNKAEEEYLPEPTPSTSDPVPTSSVKEEHEDVGTSVEERKQQNVYLDGPISSPNENKNIDPVALPADFDKRTNEVLNNIPNINIVGTEKGRKWAETIRESIGMAPMANAFNDTLEDPDSEFHQTLENNGAKFGSHEAKFKERKNTVFDGELAVLRTISHLGLGSTWNTALWNSGLWITFKPPAEDDLVELHRQLTSDQIEMGRYSYGLVYSNTTSYTVGRLCQFAAEHIYRISGNPEEINPTNILQFIKAQDIGSLLWGLACTMFPKGFVYERACTANPEKCQHVINETLNLRKLQVVNRRGLTERQKSHMAEHRSQQKLTSKDLKLYESDMVRASTHRITINEGKEGEISFNLRSPTIDEYISTGHRWIDDMVETVDQALGATASTDERNKLVDLRTRASIMRQYSHWVDSIEMDSNLIKDRSSIEKVLNSISGDRTIRTEFIKSVSKYIDNSSVSVIGIPTYDCPVCGQANEAPIQYPHQTTMIPLDVIQLFFVLLTQKHRDLANR